MSQDPALLVVSIAFFLLIGYEAAAVVLRLLHRRWPRVPDPGAISGLFWKWTIDQGERGAPIIFSLGYLFGHLVSPMTVEGSLRTPLLAASATLMAWEVLSLVKDCWSPSKGVYRLFSGFRAGVFLFAFMAGSLAFPR